MNVGIVLDPSHASFNGGANGAGTFYWGGVHGTWFWVDPTYDIVVVGMLQQQDGGNPMTDVLIRCRMCAEYRAPSHTARCRSGALVQGLFLRFKNGHSLQNATKGNSPMSQTSTAATSSAPEKYPFLPRQRRVLVRGQTCLRRRQLRLQRVRRSHGQPQSHKIRRRRRLV